MAAPLTSSVFNEKYQTFLQAMILDASNSSVEDYNALVGNSSIVGDPHVFTMGKKEFMLPVREQEWNFFKKGSVSVSVKTRNVTEEESEDIAKYYLEKMGLNKVSKRLTKKGVFMHEVTIKSEASNTSMKYNFDTKNFSGEYGNIEVVPLDHLPNELRNRFDNGQNPTGSVVVLLEDGKPTTLVLVLHYENPQMKYGMKVLTFNPEQVEGLCK